MKDNDLKNLAFIAFAIIGIWLLLRNRSSINNANKQLLQQSPVAPSDGLTSSLSPIDLVYASNPQNFGPTQIGVTVNPSLPNGLSDSYIPLFGFVGIAQGETLQ